MKEKNLSLRTPRSKAEGLGSARHGVEHWWQQRVTAIALAVLIAVFTVYTAAMFFYKVPLGTYNDAIGWLASPDRATLVILFIVVVFHHSVLGLQVVIEDYVHSEGLKIASILAVKFIAYAFAVLGVLCVVKVLFFANLVPEVIDILQRAR